MKYKVLKSFDGALRGHCVRHFEAGETVKIECADLVDVALKEKWIAPVAVQTKARTKAPRNK